jgi:hypothetical protein
MIGRPGRSGAAARIALEKIRLDLERSAGLWHITHPDRYRRILEMGALLPEPDIPETERWHSGNGILGRPFVRMLGGVSLFDFANFVDRETYCRDYPASSIASFVPIRIDWDEAVWIEMSRQAVASNLIPPDELLRRWKEGHSANAIMPGIEAAHIGRLARGSFKKAFLLRGTDGSTRSIEC